MEAVVEVVDEAEAAAVLLDAVEIGAASTVAPAEVDAQVVSVTEKAEVVDGEVIKVVIVEATEEVTAEATEVVTVEAIGVALIADLAEGAQADLVVTEMVEAVAAAVAVAGDVNRTSTE